MSGTKASVTAQADNLADRLDKAPDAGTTAEDDDTATVSLDLRSLVSTYRRQRDRGTERAQVAYARSLLKRAKREGHKTSAAPAKSSSSASGSRGRSSSTGNG